MRSGQAHLIARGGLAEVEQAANGQLGMDLDRGHAFRWSLWGLNKIAELPLKGKECGRRASRL